MLIQTYITRLQPMHTRRHFEPGAKVLWYQTRGGGGGSGKRKNEKQPVPAEVIRDDGRRYIQIATSLSSTHYRREGSWVRRTNVRPFLKFDVDPALDLFGKYIAPDGTTFNAHLTREGVLLSYKRDGWNNYFDNVPLTYSFPWQEANIRLTNYVYAHSGPRARSLRHVDKRAG